MILTKEIFEKLSNEYNFEVENNEARYLGYVVVLYFPESNCLSIWLGSDLGFKDADDFDDAVDKIEKCLDYIAKAELEYKKELGKERMRKMEMDFK